MDTLVTIEVVHGTSVDCAEEVRQAFGWFAHVEQLCNRFDKNSELSRLSASQNVPVRVSPLLFQLVDFALTVSRLSDGAFDITVGRAMEVNGFNRNYQTGKRTGSEIDSASDYSYRDVSLNHEDQTITLARPLVLDLGAVAKGFAIDLAGKALQQFKNYAIDAGGDILAAGHHSSNTPWRIGIRHPREPETLIDTLAISNAAVCTSGDYERPRPDGDTGHHLLDPKCGSSVTGIASVTVVAPTAIVADALSTAAFVMSPREALDLLEGQHIEGKIISSDLQVFETKGFSRYRP